MPELDIGGGGGGGATGLPPKVLLIAAGGLGLGLLFVLMRHGGGSAGGDNAPGNMLGPQASLALGDLTTRLGNVQGDLQQRIADLSASVSGAQGTVQQGLTDLSAHIDGQAALLSAQGASQYGTLGDMLNSLNGQIQASYGGLQQGQADILDETLAAYKALWAQNQEYGQQQYTQFAILAQNQGEAAAQSGQVLHYGQSPAVAS